MRIVTGLRFVEKDIPTPNGAKQTKRILQMCTAQLHGADHQSGAPVAQEGEWQDVPFEGN